MKQSDIVFSTHITFKMTLKCLPSSHISKSNRNICTV